MIQFRGAVLRAPTLPKTGWEFYIAIIAGLYVDIDNEAKYKISHSCYL